MKVRVFNQNYVPWCPVGCDYWHPNRWDLCRRKKMPAIKHMDPWVVEGVVTTFHPTHDEAIEVAHVMATEPTA